jgi:hypothetical protein
VTTEADVSNVLPLRPADHGSAAPLQRPEASPASADAHHAPARARAASVWLRIQLLFAGASVIASSPPSLELIWARHMASARFYKRWWARWPAWAYGAAHTWLLAAPAYLLVWVTDSRPKLIATALVIITSLWLLHVI